LSRFTVEGDPHQLRGHLPLWRPFIAAVLRHLAARNRPIAFIGFGGQAANALADAGVGEGTRGAIACILREHPARGNDVLALENPFILANRHLTAFGTQPIAW
jgi:uracil-DNA glycosylase